MSPSWRERTEVVVGPQAVHLVRVPRGLRDRPLRWTSVACTPEGGRVEAAVAALSDALSRLPVRPAAVRVVLSHHWVRFVLVPGGRALRSEAERMAAAQHLLCKVYGEEAQAWRVVLDGSGGSGAAVAAGVPVGVFDAVLHAVAAARARPLGVEPLLAFAKRSACRRHTARGAGWLAVAEPGRLLLGGLAGDRWQTLRSHRLVGSLADELPTLLEQTAVVEGIGDGLGRRVLVATVGDLDSEFSSGAAWDIKVVPIVGTPHLDARARTALG